MKYFESTWIENLHRRGRRRAPLFPIKVWEGFSRIQDDLTKTCNNNVEGWHNSFSALIINSIL